VFLFAFDEKNDKGPLGLFRLFEDVKKLGIDYFADLQ
jgi:hypothetical protein